MKRRYVWLCGSAVVCFSLLFFAFLQAGRFLEAPSQMPEKGDLIVALGGDVGARSIAAYQLYAEGLAPFVLLTGLENSPPESRSEYLNWRAQLLVHNGVPALALLFDKTSASSWEEAKNTLILMVERKIHRALVISDPPHMRRLEWVWSRVFAGSGKQYVLVASDMEGWDADHWWSNEASAQFVIMEYIKLGYYWMVH